MVLIPWAYKDKDTNKPADKLPLSEIQFQTQAPQELPEMIPEHLKLIIQWQVDNSGTWNTADEAYNLPGIKANKTVRTFSRDPTGALKLKSFDACLRIHNVKPSNWMLADRHLAFHDKLAKHVTTHPPKVPQKRLNPIYHSNLYNELE